MCPDSSLLPLSVPFALNCVLAIAPCCSSWLVTWLLCTRDLPSVQGWRWGKEGQHGRRLADFESKEAEGEDGGTVGEGHRWL